MCNNCSRNSARQNIIYEFFTLTHAKVFAATACFLYAESVSKDGEEKKNRGDKQKLFWGPLLEMGVLLGGFLTQNQGGRRQRCKV